MPLTHLLPAILCALTVHLAEVSAAPECKRFDAIYQSGKELCENMWDGAFKYETNENNAYTQWFFDKTNPNDDIARSLGMLTGNHDTCHLDYFHKDAPSPEPDTFTECHPWKDSACCSHGTVETATKLKEGYGAEYHWDRCGPLSPECERFFVQEACFYECDPNAGLYRKFAPSGTGTTGSTTYDENNEDHNKWQMHGMPIKASYCDAWFAACRKDLFCASSGGSYFSCAAEYVKVDQNAAILAQLKAAEDKAAEDEGFDEKLIIIIITAGVVIFALCTCGCVVIMKERAGKPLFGKLLDAQPAAQGGQVYGNGM